MTESPYGSAPKAGAIARAIRDGLAHARVGVKVRPSWTSEGLDEAGLRVWFRDKLDGMINLKAGLRSDGAPRKMRCACKHCMGRCDCGIRKIEARGGFVCGYGCREPWGGRRWTSDFEASASRDARAASDRLLRRVRVRRFETDLARRRLAHLESEES